MRNEDNIIRLYANCIPVKGARRSLVVDFHHGNGKFISNSLYDILHFHKGKSIKEIKGSYGNNEDAIIDEYIDFIIDNDLGFECAPSELECYPELDLAWNRPELITNAIIDIPPKDCYPLKKVAYELSLVNCKALQIRIFHPVTIRELGSFVAQFEYTPVRHIELLFPWSEEVAEERLIKLAAEYQRINSITVHSCYVEKLQYKPMSDFDLLYTNEKITSERHCGIINPTLFNFSMEAFLEAQKHNSCLNRKISVDSNGYIKNCPSMDKHYGHISEVSFLEVIEQEDFRHFSTISKDEVDVCKDCEFRYICTDCRVFLSDPRRENSKPLKCSYDPYSARWS